MIPGLVFGIPRLPNILIEVIAIVNISKDSLMMFSITSIKPSYSENIWFSIFFPLLFFPVPVFLSIRMSIFFRVLIYLWTATNRRTNL